MSLQARKWLVAHPNTIFQRQSQRDDLLDLNKTKTENVALLIELVKKGHIIEFTAIKSDHHDDSALGEHCHFNGYCDDCWPLASNKAGDYLDASDPRFQQFLKDAADSPYIHQIGLAGTAVTKDNIAAAGAPYFEDSGSDHVHLGSQ